MSLQRFQFESLDATGSACRGSVHAGSEAEAAEQLAARGLYLISLKAESVRCRGGTSGRVVSRWRRVTARHRAVFLRQLATLLNSGVPLLRALEVLARQERNVRLRGAIEACAAEVRSGGRLSAALARMPQWFDRAAVAMTRAGEASGALAVILDRVAGFAEKSLVLRARITTAAAYPAVVLAVALAIVSGLLVLVVPRFQAIFADLLRGAPLPPLTLAVLHLSEMLRSHAAVLVALSAVSGLLGMLGVRSAWGRRMWDRLLLATPGLGSLHLKAVVGRAARTLGTLVAGGVPLLEALGIAGAAAGSWPVQQAFERAALAVRDGRSLAPALAAERRFPDMMISMIEVGEETGRLAEMLERVADVAEEELNQAVATLSSMLEPALIVVLALVIGTLVVALFLPIVRVVQLLS